jgi:hypothetical protein
MEAINLQELLTTEFTTEEQRLFVHNFQCYLKFDPDKDFVINFDKVYKWIGFAQKTHAKRLLIKSFKEDTDFLLTRRGGQDSLLLCQPAQQSMDDQDANVFLTQQREQNIKDDQHVVQHVVQHGGHNKEIIMLTPNTFKDFCMRANTQKAKDIRDYYVKMERVLFKATESALQNINTKYLAANEKVKALEDDLKKYRDRRKTYNIGETVYIIKEKGRVRNLFKVGSSENMTSRAKSYFTHSNTSIIVYTRRCADCRFLEKAVHKHLSQYRFEGREEWFEVSFEVIRKAIEDFQTLLEGSLNPDFTIDTDALNEITQDIASSSTKEANAQDFSSESDVVPEPTFVIHQPQDEPVVIDEDQPLAPLPDFDAFIKDCFECDVDYTSTWVQITARYRIWARSTDNIKNELASYLQSNGFKKTHTYNEEYNTSSIAYQGIRILPLPPFVLTNTSSMIDRFLFDKCRSSTTGRISWMQLREAFVEWKQNDEPWYTRLTSSDDKAMKGHCNEHFLGAVVHDGKRTRWGYYGLCLKGDEMTGIKTKVNNRKSVQQLNPNTKEIVRVFGSITEASQAMNVHISAMSTAISTNKICKGFLFKKGVVAVQDNE